jgi:cysteine-rich repeat protein
MQQPSSCGVPRIRQWMVVVWLALGLIVSAAGVAHAQQTINPTGGTDATNGLRIVIQPNTAFQIYRNNANQLFRSNGDGLDLAVGTAVTGTNVSGAAAWTTVAQTAVTGAGTAVAPWQVTTTVRTTTNFVVAMTIRYVLPDDTLDLQVVITPPAGNAEQVKYYHYFDSYLSGGDNGAAFWQPNSTINPPPTIPTVLGVTKLVGAVRQYEVFIAGTPLWNRYYSAQYSAPYSQMSNGGNLSNALDTNEATDNGFGAQWDLGAITTPQTIRYRLSFSDTASTPVCGDGVSAGFEGCDDGNTSDNDGCSALCQVEAGYVCVGTPSVCAIQCGDGIRAGSEGCDDGNTSSGDGCSATCTTESGWSCAGSPSTCMTTCGDGIRAGAEACDDGDTSSGDGCSATCTTEGGWSCTTAVPNVCTTTCGDGVRAGAEACDDGDTSSGDGCSATCTTEGGWSCAGSPSTCTTTCGDGVRAGAEACDDGDTSSGDGCSATCTTEGGWSCTTAVPNVCTTTCGDGVRAGAEACDDGNTDERQTVARRPARPRAAGAARRRCRTSARRPAATASAPAPRRATTAT